MKITIGALAHVDAGKTTLSESILFKTNVIRKKGRVDSKDSFLDYDSIEKEKGITIYNKLANFKYKDKEYIYIDTPGHSDLAYESNRAINILDCAILLVSAIEEIPVDTIKRFNSLLNSNIPILIFVNKMDISNFDKSHILYKIQTKLSDKCVKYTKTDEFISLSSEELLDQYIKNNKVDDEAIVNSLRNNEIIPCFFGSALKDDGVDEMLEYIYKYINVDYKDDSNLNAYIYKLSNDYQYLKILSGTLKNKDSFGEYKINEMFEVNGNNYLPIQSAKAGEIVAVRGLKNVEIGTYIPSFTNISSKNIPSLKYRLICDVDANDLYKKCESIRHEYPELNIHLENKQIFINLNSELHAIIIKKIFKEKLNIDIDFSDPIIRYKETIDEEVYGIGHFEPLRHYGEAIVRLKPYENGVIINSNIDNSYVNTLLSYLRSFPIKGILTNSQLTNLEITIIDIKTHPKHTEGGDLIQSVKRAIRQALTKTNSTLLEPNYLVSIITNEHNINEIISYITLNCFTYTIENDNIIVQIPQISFNNTITNLRSKLQGQLDFSIIDTIYDKCNNQDEIINSISYDYKNDMHNPAGSVFCKNGAGHYVDENEVESLMHLNMSDYVQTVTATKTSHKAQKISEEELKRVWNSLYKPRERYVEKTNKNENYEKQKTIKAKPIMYLIDGYNLMYYLDEENALNDLISSRENTINTICDFSGYVNAEIIVVFDAYKTSSVLNEVIKRDNITLVYTQNKITADYYIEHKVEELEKEYKLIVVTSDIMEQMKVYSNNASIISSREFVARYENMKKNSTKLNNTVHFKPFEDLRKLLEED